MITFYEAKCLLEAYREDPHERELVDFISDYDLAGENTKNHPQSELFRAVYCAVKANSEKDYYRLMSVTEIEEAEDELL